ncbi:MAG TPA: hypothetical protein VFK44_04220 [Bacillales bacterium]|nr:hypothetical protein [Bacillales bacterium]
MNQNFQHRQPNDSSGSLLTGLLLIIAFSAFAGGIASAPPA